MKKVRISDIAKKANVSNATVSRALNQKNLVNPETYERIQEAITSLGYQHPSYDVFSISPSFSHIIIADLPSLENPFYHEILVAIEGVAERYDYHILMHTAGPKSLLETAREISAAGIITFNTYTKAQLDRLCSVTAVVQCCEFLESYPLPYVSIDDYKAALTALNYLYSLGHRNFSLINTSGNQKYALERSRAFADFLDTHKLVSQENWNIQIPDVNYPMALSAVSYMLSTSKRPDAIFATSDVFAAAAIKAAHQVGLEVPKDLSIVGFDNIPLSEMSNPSITTVKQPKSQLGYMAGEFLIEKIKNPSIKNKQFLLDTELIIRESTR